MKVLARILSLFTLLAVATLYTSCGGGDDPDKTQEQIQFEKLKGTWTVSEVELDGVPRIDDFTTTTPMTLTFAGTYSNPGGTYLMQVNGSRPTNNPWDVSSSWKFGGDVTRQIIRIEDDLEMVYTLTGSELTITFQYEGIGFIGQGRLEQVTGDWEFTFTK